jgi:hypothetical protein
MSRRHAGRNNKGTGAQQILDFTKDFIQKKNRYPKIREYPIKKVTIVYHFGSYETLLQLAKMGEKDLPVRKSKEKRYCRYCGQLLPLHRWFFCEFVVDDCTNKVNCEEKFAEENSQILTEEEVKRKVKKTKRKMWHKCKECKEKCKIYLPKHLTEPPCLFICKADPEYEEINEKLSKSL